MAAALTSSIFTDAVAAAVRAPSLHNSQPWRFRLTGDAIEVYADLKRRLASTDPTGWGMRISIGAAICNLRLALIEQGQPTTVTLRPDPANSALMARVVPVRPRPATPVEHELYAAIAKRHSNRQPFAEVLIPGDIRTRLLNAAHDEGGWLDFLIGPTALDGIGLMARKADQTLAANPAYQKELAAWSRRGADAVDGVPAHAGGPAPEPYDLLARRDFGGPPRAAGQEFEREPLVGVIGAYYGDTATAELFAGQVMERTLLTATVNGLAASLISQPIEVPAYREQLRLALGRRHAPQMVARFGYAVSTSPSPRRPLTDVIIKD
jgi:nitroreductase